MRRTGFALHSITNLDIAIEKLQQRVLQCPGISSARRRYLLRDLSYFSSMERTVGTRYTSGSDSSTDRSAEATDLRQLSRGTSGESGCSQHTEDLRAVLRDIAEFTAATGSCGDGRLQLSSGYADVSGAREGLRRAALVVRYTERALTLSNNVLKDAYSQTFRPRRFVAGGEFDGCGDFNDMLGPHKTLSPMRSEGAPLTPLEVVSLVHWCAWHVQASLRCIWSSSHSIEKPKVDGECRGAVLLILKRFTSITVEECFQRCAVCSVEDELALSDIVSTIFEEVLRVLRGGEPLTDRNEPACSPPSTLFSDEDAFVCEEDRKQNTVPLHSPLCTLDPRIGEEAQRLLLCSQRERWDRALRLLVQLHNWNQEVIGSQGASTETLPGEKITAHSSSVHLFSSDVLLWIHGMSEKVFYTLQYILAQHGQWHLCTELWKARAHDCAAKAPPCGKATLRFGSVSNILTALAYVNADPKTFVATTTGSQPGEDSAAFSSAHCELPRAQMKLLPLLLHLGVVPQRPFTATQFASLLRDSFGLQPSGHGVSGILSPASVWRGTGGLPPHVRSLLCLICFQVVARSGLVNTLTLEDLYVVICVSQRVMRSQLCDTVLADINSMMQKENTENRTSIGAPPTGLCDIKDFNLFADIFVAATRRTAITVGAHILTITEAFVSRVNEQLPKHGGRPEHEQHNKGENDRQLEETSCCMHLSSTACPRGSTVMFSIICLKMMELLASTPYSSTLIAMWQVALFAATSVFQFDASNKRLTKAMSVFAEATAKKAVEPDGAALLDPLVGLAPYLSSFCVSRVVQGPVGRRLTWYQCLALLPYAPSASAAQRLLLRRVARAGDVTFLPPLCYMLRTAIPPSQLIVQAPENVSTDVRTLLLLTERCWWKALQLYEKLDVRVQRACARHVLRLVLSAEVWVPHARSCATASSQSYCFEGFELLLRTALQAVDGEHVVEDIMRVCLRRGLWASGLAFHQRLRCEQPELILRNGTVEAYAVLLCKGMLSHTALAQTMAAVLRHARAARWMDAYKVFLQYGSGANTNVMSGEGYGEEVHAGSVPFSLNSCSSLFHHGMPAGLSHFAHTVRYSMLCCPGQWQNALNFVPSQVLPLPFHHKLLLARASGSPVESLDAAIGCALQGEKGNMEAVDLPRPLSMSLVQVALLGKIHRAKAQTFIISQASVEQTLRALQKHGQWEQALLVYEHSVARHCFPHTAGASVIAACLSSWEMSLNCFTHLSQRMRPDTMASTFALQACVCGRQWKFALNILQQCVLTASSPTTNAVARVAPSVVSGAVRAVLSAGIWDTALCIARRYEQTTSPSLANTILVAYVRAHRFDEAVNFFYGCVRRGVWLQDDSLDLVIMASQTVSAGYRDMARFVTVMASTLEDFYHVQGVLRQHVLVVCRNVTFFPHVTILSFMRAQSSTPVATAPDAEVAGVAAGR